jgi:hypothetical protein
MPQTDIPSNPTKSPFGYPRPERLEAFKTATESANGATHRVTLQGQVRDFPIIKVRINVPKYRMENGRTSSAQVEHLAKYKEARKDLFSGDPELLDAQEAQHQLLLKLVGKSVLRKKFEDAANKQVDPILLDSEGYVVNGNRRLATWRELLMHGGQEYKHFEWIDVVVLPTVDEKAIDKLEAELQIEEDIKADYSWDAEANMMLAKREREGYTNKELGELYGMKESEVTELLDMREYAAEWLSSRGKQDMWSEVVGDELAFRRVVTGRSKVGGPGRQDLFKKAAFALIDNPKEVNDSLHDAINNLGNHIGLIVEKLQKAFDVKPPKDDASVDDMFGGGGGMGGAEAVDLALAKEIENEDKATEARRIIVDVIEAEKLKKRENKSANKLLDTCAKANSALQEACMALTPEAKTDGVDAQLQAIEKSIQAIRAFIGKK